MARTIQQIKQELTDAFLADTTLAEKYGFTQGADFDSTFSKVSIENLLLYIVAAAIWTHEKIFDTHKTEVEDIIAQLKPHTLRWYVSKAKLFRYGQPLIDGTDQYDDTGLNDDDISQSQIVHFAAASESSATVFIKVAAGSDADKHPLDSQQLASFRAYLAEVKDAGVRVEIINSPACRLALKAVIYYDPLVLDAEGKSLITAEYTVINAIKSYIANLPFNGEYSNTALTDALQNVGGVEIPEIIAAYESFDGDTFTPIDVKATPHSGYYELDEDKTTIEYRPYETV